MDLIKDFLQDKIKEKYLVERIFKLKQQMEWDDIIRSHNGEWIFISVNRDLPEDFIREYQDNIIWGLLSVYQNLSEEILEEFHERVNWRCVFLNKARFSPEFLEKFKHKLDLN